MLHFPSLAVGCLFSGAAFLVVHEQLSHRRRLSKKWEIRGKLQGCVHNLLASTSLIQFLL